ncbi:MAG: hypothetical protein AAFX99_37185, partial [Myxococcota bacterium]
IGFALAVTSENRLYLGRTTWFECRPIDAGRTLRWTAVLRPRVAKSPVAGRTEEADPVVIEPRRQKTTLKGANALSHPLEARASSTRV